MDWSIAIGVAIVVVVLGGIAARLWWNLAHKAAPYGDERADPRKQSQENVVVIKDEWKS
jgi:hypothetical protein